MKAVRGTWVSCNVFITTQGEELAVCAFPSDMELFRTKLPLKCFLLIDDQKIIFGIVEDTYE